MHKNSDLDTLILLVVACVAGILVPLGDMNRQLAGEGGHLPLLAQITRSGHDV